MDAKLEMTNYEWKNKDLKSEDHYFLSLSFLDNLKLLKEKKNMIITIIFALLFASTLIALIILVSYQKRTNERCITAECLETALILRKQISEDVDPCIDFYEFSCGKFITSMKNESELQDRSYIKYITDDFLNELQSIIDKAWISNNLPDTMRKFFVAYNTYRNHRYVNENDIQWLIKFFAKIGGWPMIEENWRDYTYDWEENYAKAMMYAGHSSIFSIFVTEDRRNTKKNIITIIRSPQNIINSMFKMKRIASLEVLKNLGLLVENFREQLNELELLDRELVNEEITDMQQLMNERETEFMTVEKLQKSIPEINWERLLGFVFINAPKKWKVTSQTEVLISGKSSLSQLLRKINSKVFSKRQLANYLCINLAADLITSFPLKNYSILIPSDRIVVAELIESFGYAIDYLYYANEKFQERSNFSVVFINFLKEFLSESLSDKYWLDSKTKKLVKEKIGKLMISTGFPEFIKNASSFERYYENLPEMTSNPYENKISLMKFAYQKNIENLSKLNNRETWLPYNLPATKVSPFYFVNYNKAVITQMFQLSPILNTNYPAYMNFGRFGFFVAHEIIHSLDINGITRSSIGNVMNQWSESSKRSYYERIKCLINQYGSYEALKSRKLISKNTINEDIADNGALRQAYLAYKKYIKQKGEINSLAGFEKYTPEQMFFISYATMWCDANSDVQIESVSKIRSPNKFRIIGTVSNMKEFSEAFGCQSKTPMNPENKCVLW